MTSARLALAATLGALTLATTACTGLETGNSLTPPTLTAALTVADSPAFDATGAAFALDVVRANVRRIDIDLPAGTSCVGLPGLVSAAGDDDDGTPYTNVCQLGGAEIRLNGPWVIDLVARTATPPLPTITVPAGAYRRVDVRFDDADPDDGHISASDPLAEHTLFATGTVPVNGTATPFRLLLDFSEDARFDASSDLVLAEDVAHSVLLELDPSAWFAALPLARCAEDGDLTVEGGVLLLEDDGGDCSDIEGAIKDAIKASGELRRD